MLEIKNLSVEYFRRGQTISAVQDFSLTINAGETVGLVGESGSGKSTVALAILRLFRAQEGRMTSGKILFDGMDLASLSEKQMEAIRGKRISMIFQDPFTSLDPVMRIDDQLKETLQAHGLPAFKEVLTDALMKVQLEPVRVLSSYPHQLSGGQRQRVMIALALMTRPEVILADEPTTALDVLVQKEILDLLFKLQQDLKVSLLFITHNLSLMAQFARRVVVMKAGVVVEEARTQELFKNPRQPYTRELLSSIPRLPRP